MKLLLPCCAGIVFSTAVLAAGPRDESVRASMLVTGTIQEAPDGGVATYAIDHPERLPSAVRSLLANAIPNWKFDPLKVEGNTVASRVPIAVRVVATTMDGDKVRLEIEGVHFGPPDHHPGIAVVKQEKPVYPPAAEHALVHGTVYLAMRVDPAGKVADVAVQQVDMGVVGRDAELNHWRELLGRVSKEAASRWLFTPASSAAAPYRIVRVSITFGLRSLATGGSTKPAYGHWNVYEPGPVRPVPWLDDQQATGGVDALPDGDIDLVGHGLRMQAKPPRT